MPFSVIRSKFLELAADTNIDFEGLEAIQKKIAREIVIQDDYESPIQFIGGVDSAYLGDSIITACVIMQWPELEIVEEKFIQRTVTFPYRSTYFTFREGPSILEVMESIEEQPTLLLVNSHGVMHPRFAGCASHLGFLMNQVTIGVARNPLCGESRLEPGSVGEWVPIFFKRRIVGAKLLSQVGRKAIFVSVGHRISLETAVEIVKKSLRGNLLPEPLHCAHLLANQKKRSLLDVK
jgi:deoxyribonuclease V